MKIIPVLLLLFPFACFGQVGDSSWFDRKNYAEKKRGEDDGYPFVIVYVNQKDSGFVLKRNYFMDSSYNSNSYLEMSYYKGEPEGPRRSVIDGKLASISFYKNGRRSGEALRYDNGVLVSKQYFDNGTRTGTWEEYSSKGTLLACTTYEKNISTTKKYNRGILVSLVIYDDSLHMIKRDEEYNEQGKLVTLSVTDDQGNCTINKYSEQGKLLTTVTYNLKGILPEN